MHGNNMFECRCLLSQAVEKLSFSENTVLYPISSLLSVGLEAICQSFSA